MEQTNHSAYQSIASYYPAWWRPVDVCAHTGCTRTAFKLQDWKCTVGWPGAHDRRLAYWCMFYAGILLLHKINYAAQLNLTSEFTWSWTFQQCVMCGTTTSEYRRNEGMYFVRMQLSRISKLDSICCISSCDGSRYCNVVN